MQALQTPTWACTRLQPNGKRRSRHTSPWKRVLAPTTPGPLIKLWMMLDVGRTGIDAELRTSSGRLAASSCLDHRHNLDDRDLAPLDGT